jgi:branched-chain amino acid transport system substrate-binding protein
MTDRFRISRRILLTGVAGSMMALAVAGGAQAADPVKVGLVAALSGQSAKSGESITRGLTVAIE